MGIGKAFVGSSREVFGGVRSERASLAVSHSFLRFGDQNQCGCEL